MHYSETNYTNQFLTIDSLLLNLKKGYQLFTEIPYLCISPKVTGPFVSRLV